jgi:hypothetical protein
MLKTDQVQEASILDKMGPSSVGLKKYRFQVDLRFSHEGERLGVEPEVRDISGFINSVKIVRDFVQEIYPIFQLELSLPKEMKFLLQKAADEGHFSLSIACSEVPTDFDKSNYEDDLSKNPEVIYDAIELRPYDPDRSPETQTAEVNDNTAQFRMIIFAFAPNLMESRRFCTPRIYGNSSLAEAATDILSGFPTPLIFFPPNNTERYEQILIPPVNAVAALMHLDKAYGIFETGAMLFADVRGTYLIPADFRKGAPERKDGKPILVEIEFADQNQFGIGEYPGMMEAPLEEPPQEEPKQESQNNSGQSEDGQQTGPAGINASDLEGGGEEVGEKVGTKVGSEVGKEVGQASGEAAGNAVAGPIGGFVGGRIGSVVGEKVGGKVGGFVGKEFGGVIEAVGEAQAEQSTNKYYLKLPIESVRFDLSDHTSKESQGEAAKFMYFLPTSHDFREKVLMGFGVDAEDPLGVKNSENVNEAIYKSRYSSPFIASRHQAAVGRSMLKASVFMAGIDPSIFTPDRIFFFTFRDEEYNSLYAGEYMLETLAEGYLVDGISYANCQIAATFRRLPIGSSMNPQRTKKKSTAQEEGSTSPEQEDSGEIQDKVKIGSIKLPEGIDLENIDLEGLNLEGVNLEGLDASSITELLQ